MKAIPGVVIALPNLTPVIAIAVLIAVLGLAAFLVITALTDARR